MPSGQPTDPSTLELLANPHCIGDLLEGHRPRLKKMVRARLDRRLRDRLDESDIVQAAQLEAVRRLPEFLDEPGMPFFLWLRFLTAQELQVACRRHLGAAARDVRREVGLQSGAPESTPDMLQELVVSSATPSGIVVKEESMRALHDALARIDPVDREVLVLRHFEHLSNQETAQELGIQEAAASKRYVRALRRIEVALREILGPETEFRRGLIR